MSLRKHASTFTVSLALAALLLFVPIALAAQQEPTPAPASSPAAATTEPAASPRLLEIKYICVDRFGNDPLGVQAQEMVIARLFEAKRFRLTENCEKADFVLKGSITERSDRAYRRESEGIGFGTSASASSGGTSASGSISGNAQETLASSEVKVQAAVTLRVVDREGEILWAASLESTGGKTKGAIGDAAERAVKRLLRDIERAEKQKTLPQ